MNENVKATFDVCICIWIHACIYCL